MTKVWAAYRRYFLNHIPAHFIGFVMGAAYVAFCFAFLVATGALP